MLLNPDSGVTQSTLARADYFFLSGEAGVQTGLGRSGRSTGERKMQHCGRGEGEGEGGRKGEPGAGKGEPIASVLLGFFYY